MPAGPAWPALDTADIDFLFQRLVLLKPKPYIGARLKGTYIANFTDVSRTTADRIDANFYL